MVHFLQFPNGKVACVSDSYNIWYGDQHITYDCCVRVNGT